MKLFISNSKYFVLASILFFIISPCLGQVKIKKGIIYHNEKPIAHLEGKSGLLKITDLKITSLDNKPIMTIKGNVYDFKNPIFKNHYYQLIQFQDTGEELKIKYECVGEKCIVEKLIELNLLNSSLENRTASIAINDFSEELSQDTLLKKRQEKLMIEELNNCIHVSSQEKDIFISKKEAKPTLINKSPETFMVFQGNQQIGHYTKNTESYSHYSPETTYFVYVQCTDKPILVAHIKQTLSSFDIFTLTDKRKISFSPKNTNDPDRELMTYLLQRKYL